MVYQLEKIGKGKHAIWQCRVALSNACGSGSRPDLAIRNWHEQDRRCRAHTQEKLSRPYVGIRRRKMMKKLV